jgi:hypothetical protein
LPRSTDQHSLWAPTLVLVAVGLALSCRADDLSIWPDESWSVFHSSRSVEQILREPDAVWPPGYYLLLHGWIRITGTTHDFVLHVAGVLIGLLAAACLIRVGRSLRLPFAGELAALAIGTSSYAVYFLLELRGYGLMLLAEAAFLWAYLRWLNRPGRGRDLVLLASLAAMLYSHFILGVVIVLATGHVALTAPARLGRWLVLVGAGAVLFSPLLPQFVHAFQLRNAVAASGPLPGYFRLGFDSFIRAYSAHWHFAFAAVLLAVAAGMARAVRQLGWRTPLWLAIWAVGLPLAAFAARDRAAFFTARHLAFSIPATFVLVGAGLSSLPWRWIGVGLLGLLAFAPWQPFDFRPAYTDFPPVRDFLRAMARSYQPGDRLVVDPSLAAHVASMEWEYYRPLYLPAAEPMTTASGPSVDRRVWYLVRGGSGDPELRASLASGRAERLTWGPWYLHATLFEAPPDVHPTRFDNGLVFYGADIDRTPTVHAGDILQLTLWWSSDRPVPTETIAWLSMRNPGGSIVVEAGAPTRTMASLEDIEEWTPQRLYLDVRRLRIPFGLKDGTYTLELALRDSTGQTQLGTSEIGGTIGPLILDSFHLYSAAFW